MGCASKQNQHGFTLVEISIVMIIIGLLIGGTFGGMKLIENMQVNKTVQDLKSINSASLTFKDTYGRLPGDIRNPSTRLPNCTVAPCATGGDGNRSLDTSLAWSAPIADTNERYTYWSHLQAADLLSLGVKNTTDMSFGEGQPSLSIGSGVRATYGLWPSYHSMFFTHVVSSTLLGGSADDLVLSPEMAQSLDIKMDDGKPQTGRFYVISGCYSGPYGATAIYSLSGSCAAFYRTAF